MTPRARAVGRQLRQHVERAADLEGAHRLQVLALDPERMRPAPGPATAATAPACAAPCRATRSAAARMSSSETSVIGARHLRELVAGVVGGHRRRRGYLPRQLREQLHVLGRAAEVPRRVELIGRLVVVLAVVGLLLRQQRRGRRAFELLRLGERQRRHAGLGQREVVRAEEVAALRVGVLADDAAALRRRAPSASARATSGRTRASRCPWCAPGSWRRRR